MFLQSDDSRDVELITSGIDRAAVKIHTGRQNVILDYNHGEEFEGTFQIEVQVDAESEKSALDCLANELAMLLHNVVKAGGEVGHPSRLALHMIANPIGNPVCG